ncbi:hypothetical protein [Salinisphaera sp. G21_0]|uniref:hypothetical protein n=1 Tax=Salinisphaera sp. G21_0 TaxID=2821094 RepID=UPI001ADBD480|nr:hypothetical protein [Salinisphaera sp. G21_0]MBO9484666.1 hypothetical protein [Salinisphaera sp. G21_0]
MKKTIIISAIAFLSGCAAISPKDKGPENVISYSYSNFGSPVDKILPIFRQTNSIKHKKYEFYYDALNDHPWDEIYSKYCTDKGWEIQSSQKWYEPRFCISKESEKIEYTWMTGTGSVSFSQKGYNHGGWAQNRSVSGFKTYLVVLRPFEKIEDREKVGNMVINIYNQVASRK